MKCTKLEEYIAIIKTLAHQGPLKPSHIAALTNINIDALKGHLDFLTEQGIIKEQKSGKKPLTYVTTTRAFKILKFFGVGASIEAKPNNLYG